MNFTCKEKGFTGSSFKKKLLHCICMVQFSQTSWQEYSLSNVLETLSYVPMRVAIDTQPILYYTFPKNLAQGEIIRYTLVAGFNKIRWTGIISAISQEESSQITVRLHNGPFRGFTAKHQFEFDGALTVCRDDMSFQGFSDFAEGDFAPLMKKAMLVYAIPSRIEARDIILSVESKRQTQSFEALDQSATAG